MPALGFEQRSGRVISLARVLLATVFLVAIWADVSQPAQAPVQTYGLLSAYVLLAAAILLATWNDWWLDAKLAGPLLILDVLVFAGLTLFTSGYTSPFFLFFVFVLLSAAIRWGWRQTATAAAALVILYLAIGVMYVAREQVGFEVERFIIRSAYLIVLSCLLIWFGVHQGLPQGIVLTTKPEDPDERLSAPERVLSTAMSAARAGSGFLLWRDFATGEEASFFSAGGRVSGEPAVGRVMREDIEQPFLYRLDYGRALTVTANREFEFHRTSQLMSDVAAVELGLYEGLAVPLRWDTGDGELFLEGMDALSTDHLHLGEQLVREIAAQMRRRALLDAVEESGEARARLSLARDLHDNVVQFLAGAAFRIEAMMRHCRSGADVQEELGELKALMLQEQSDLRSFIGALRTRQDVDLQAMAAELEKLARKLGEQWNIRCRFVADMPQQPVPAKLFLDAQQLMRESVANAVRHGKASAVDISLRADDDRLYLDLVDDGGGFPEVQDGRVNGSVEPRSLKERVAESGGALAVRSSTRGTNLTISLPTRRSAN